MFSRRMRSRSKSLSRRIRTNKQKSPTNQHKHIVNHHYTNAADHASNTSSSDESIDAAPPRPETVTISCASMESYTSKFPNRVPTVLQNFYELGNSVRSAFALHPVTFPPAPPGAAANVAAVCVGRDCKEDGSSSGNVDTGIHSSHVLQKFVEHVTFLLSLTDELASDQIARRTLKNDTAFKLIRDSIKSGGRLMEEVFVVEDTLSRLRSNNIRSERNNNNAASKQLRTIRLILNPEQIRRVRMWNQKVHRAVEFTNESTQSSSTASMMDPNMEQQVLQQNLNSNGKSHRGRSPSFSSKSAQQRRKRAPTPTPPLHPPSLLPTPSEEPMTNTSASTKTAALAQSSNKIELTQTIQDLLLTTRETIDGAELTYNAGEMEDLSQEHQPIAAAVVLPNSAHLSDKLPTLPQNYIHRARLTNQISEKLISPTASLDREDEVRSPGPVSVDCDVAFDEENDDKERRRNQAQNSIYTTLVTTRHLDKRGVGKSVVALAAVLSTEVRRHFDCVLYINLHHRKLTEVDVRMHYHNIIEELTSAGISLSDSNNQPTSLSSLKSKQHWSIDRYRARLGTTLSKLNVLLFVDNLCHQEDLHWFAFANLEFRPLTPPHPQPLQHYHPIRYRLLVTTRLPPMDASITLQHHTVQVRILTEAEATRLFFSSTSLSSHNLPDVIRAEAAEVAKCIGNAPLGTVMLGKIFCRMGVHRKSWQILLKMSRDVYSMAAEARSFEGCMERVVELQVLGLGTDEEEQDESDSIQLVYRACAQMQCGVMYSLKRIKEIFKDEKEGVDILLELGILQRSSQDMDNVFMPLPFKEAVPRSDESMSILRYARCEDNLHIDTEYVYNDDDDDLFNQWYNVDSIRDEMQQIGLVHATLLQIRRLMLASENINHISSSILEATAKVLFQSDSALFSSMSYCLLLLASSVVNISRENGSTAVFLVEQAIGISRFSSSEDNYHSLCQALECSGYVLNKLNQPRVAALRYYEAFKILDGINPTVEDVECLYDFALCIHNVIETVPDENPLVEIRSLYARLTSIYDNLYSDDVHINTVHFLARSNALYGEVLTSKYSEYSAGLEKLVVARNLYLSTDAKELESMLLLFQIAGVNVKKRNAVGAIMSYMRGIDELRAHFGSTRDMPERIQSEVISAHFKLTQLYMKRKDYDVAIGVLDTLLFDIDKSEENKTSAAGSPLIEHIGKAHIRSASVNQLLERTDQAVYHMRRALEIYTLRLGVGHRDTQAIAHSLRLLQKQQNKQVDIIRDSDTKDTDENIIL